MRIEERRSDRTYPQSERIAWRRHSGGPLRAARVLNISATGVALALEGPVPLHHGELIRTLARRKGPPRAARIVRIEEDHESGRREIRLGCRWVTRPEGKRPRTSSRPSKHWELWDDDAQALCPSTCTQESAA